MGLSLAAVVAVLHGCSAPEPGPVGAADAANTLIGYDFSSGESDQVVVGVTGIPNTTDAPLTIHSIELQFGENPPVLLAAGLIDAQDRYVGTRPDVPPGVVLASLDEPFTVPAGGEAQVVVVIGRPEPGRTATVEAVRVRYEVGGEDFEVRLPDRVEVSG